ncbi:MAG TPA: hypothetical protein VFH39_04295 [Candidatus Saccharimonadales bacterium]|nr:hypothetical protein [Candidatus Saccharimonadales bacterium]
MNRTEQAQSAPASNSGSTQASRSAASRRPEKEDNKWKRVGVVSMLFALTVLVVALIVLVFVNPSNTQSKYIDSSKYQAVFLTNGQVYFGNLNSVGSDYFRLDNIYYLTQNTTTNSNGQTTTDGNYTLVKLGCQQIHDPLDQMIIERNQVSFWENLNDSGKVVTSIKQFQKQNPNGPDCSQVSTQTQSSNNATTNNQGGSSAATGTNSGTSTPSNSVKKP